MNSLTHTAAQEWILSGRALSREETALLGEHLAGCVQCRDFADFHTVLLKDIPRAMPTMAHSGAGVHQRTAVVLASLKQRTTVTRFFSGTRALALGLSALVLVALLAFLIVRLIPEGKRVPAKPGVTPTVIATLTPVSIAPTASPSLRQIEVITSENAHRITTLDYLGKGRITGIAWSPDGTQLAVAATAGITLVDMATYKETHLGTSGNTTGVAFSPNGAMLVSAEYSTLRLWDVESGKELRIFKGHKGTVYSVAFSPDGKVLASGSQDMTIKLWDVENGEELFTLKGHNHYVYQVAFSPKGRIVASIAGDEALKLWDYSSGQELSSISLMGFFAISPDGTMIASGSYSKSIELFNAANGMVQRILEGHTLSVTGFAFSPDGKVLASGSQDTTLKLWDIASGEELRTLKGHTEGVERVEFSPDGTRLASGTGKTIKIWDVASGQELHTITRNMEISGKTGPGIPDGYGEPANSVAFSPDGNILAAGLADGEAVKLYDVPTGELLAELQANIGFINSVAFSPNGKMLAAGGGRYNPDELGVQIWDVATRELLLPLDDFSDSVNSVAFSPDSKLLATGWGHPWAMTGSVKIWDVATGALRTEFGLGRDAATRALRTVFGPGKEGSVRLAVLGTAFSPNGTFLAVIYVNGRVQLWDEVNQREGPVLIDEPNVGYSSGFALAFSPNSELLAIAEPGTVSRDVSDLGLWDVATGKLRLELKGHNSMVMSVAFNADGRVLASASLDGSVRLWDVETGKILAVLEIPSAVSAAFSQDGRLLATSGWGDAVRFWGVPTQ